MRAVETEERRIATVLFADLSGFTAFSERTDPEEVRTTIDHCLGRMGEIVEKYGGTVTQVMGDSMVERVAIASELNEQALVEWSEETRREPSSSADALACCGRARTGSRRGR